MNYENLLKARNTAQLYLTLDLKRDKKASLSTTQRQSRSGKKSLSVFTSTRFNISWLEIYHLKSSC